LLKGGEKHGSHISRRDDRYFKKAIAEKSAVYVNFVKDCRGCREWHVKLSTNSVAVWLNKQQVSGNTRRMKLMEYLTAEEIVARVKDKIVFLPSQEQMVWNVAGVLNMHLRRIRAVKEGSDPALLPQVSQLILAPTGSGKTFLISRLAEAAGLDFHVLDASMLTRSGFKGINIDEALEAFQRSSIHDFDHSVILLDEFDKCAQRDSYSNSGDVQPNLLKLLEGTQVVGEKGTYHTSGMLFLFCGAFQDLAELVQGRMQKASPCRKMGFAIDHSAVSRPEKTEQDWLAQATLDDVQRYGFSRELLGRIGSIGYIPALQKEDYRILLQQGKASALGKYQTLLAVDGVTLEITEQGADLVSEQAIQRNIGARAVNAIISEAMQPVLLEVDKNKSIVRAILEAGEEGLEAQYLYGERRQKEPVKETLPKIDVSHMSLAIYLLDDEGINDVCIQMMEVSRSRFSSREYLACYSFLQMILRFLAFYCKREDQMFINIKRIVNGMNKERTKKGVFEFLDRLLEVVLQEEEPNDQDGVVLHYYELLRYLWKGNTLFLIKKLVAEINMHWAQLVEQSKHPN